MGRFQRLDLRSRAYAQTPELIELARAAARHGGIYASHIRSEGAGLASSIDEAIAIGKGARLPVHISHLKASGRAHWGTVGQVLDRIAAALGRPGSHRRPVSLHRFCHQPCRDGRAGLGLAGYDG